MAAVAELARTVGIAPACRALVVPRAAWYRDRRAQDAAQAPPARPTPARALSAAERAAIVAVLHTERFGDQAPAEVYAT
jgi:putative transposase